MKSKPTTPAIVSAFLLLAPPAVPADELAPVATLAGLPGQSGSADGTGSAARFNGPFGITVAPNGTLIVADEMNNTIRCVSQAGVVTTLAGQPSRGYRDGPGTAALFNWPAGVAVDSAGNVYVADMFNNAIRKVSPSRQVTTLAGAAGVSGTNDGPGGTALFHNPYGIAVGPGGTLLYVADTLNHSIRSITPGGYVQTLAGLGGTSGSNDGTGSAARFNNPSGIAVDAAGNVYVADSGNYTIRKVTPSGQVTTLAGQAGKPGAADGQNAQFNFPGMVALDAAGNLFITDAYINNTVRVLTPAGVTRTLAGQAGSAGSADGIGSAARFDQPTGIAVDPAEELFIADGGNSDIRTIASPRPVLGPPQPDVGALQWTGFAFTGGWANQPYTVERSTDLHTWIQIQGACYTSPSTLPIPVDPAPMTNSALFYRALWNP